MATDLKRLARFGLTGLVTTAIAYGVFVGLLRLSVPYLAAAAAAWAVSLVVGFVVNRRFTFGIVGADRYRRDLGVYAVGAVLQLLLSLVGYAALIGQLHFNPTVAFVINLAITTSFSYLFLRFVTFRRAARGGPAADGESQGSMSPGRIARGLLGPAFPVFGEIYRRVFVDMNKVTDWMIGRIPDGGAILDVGGGDGYVANLLLTKRADIRVTMTDVAADIGGQLVASNRDRIDLRPRTAVADVEGSFDVLTLSDVVHHVPREARAGFFADIAATAHRTGCRIILVKEVEPRGLRARLAEWADHHITGDRQVRLLAPDEVALPGYICTETAMPDFPNYCLKFERVRP